MLPHDETADRQTPKIDTTNKNPSTNQRNTIETRAAYEYVDVVVVESEVGEQRERIAALRRRRLEELEEEAHQHDDHDEHREQRKESDANAEQRERARLDARATHDVNQPEQIDHGQYQLADQEERKVRIVLRLVVLRIVQRPQLLQSKHALFCVVVVTHDEARRSVCVTCIEKTTSVVSQNSPTSKHFGA